MKNIKKHLVLTLIVLLGLTGCVKDYSILVSTQDLRFGLQPDSQTITINANCKWTITKNDEADWYTISRMSGKANDSIITVTVKDYSGGDFRGTSFVISSPGGHIRRTVFVSQNKLDFDGMINKIFGVMSRETWATDYAGQIIEDEYKHKEYNPYDTTTGYLMYFLEDSIGIQRDHHTDTVAWWPFKYSFDPDNLILHIDFETIDGSPESYAPNVLTASDSLYRFVHEYRSHMWERVDMRKIGIIIPSEKEILQQKVSKRKKDETIFISD